VNSISTKQNEVNEQLTEAVVETAVFIRQRGWAGPARLLLEAGAPLAFLGGQLLWLTQPVLSLLLPTTRIKQTALILEDPAALIALQQQLQEDAR
jgi:hypothetical protein